MKLPIGGYYVKTLSRIIFITIESSILISKAIVPWSMCILNQK